MMIRIYYLLILTSKWTISNSVLNISVEADCLAFKQTQTQGHVNLDTRCNILLDWTSVWSLNYPRVESLKVKRINKEQVTINLLLGIHVIVPSQSAPKKHKDQEKSPHTFALLKQMCRPCFSTYYARKGS